MQLSEYCAPHGKKTELARQLGCDGQLVWQWATGVRAVPLDRCMPIERATNGLVTRKDTCPNDWHIHWPELGDQQVVTGDMTVSAGDAFGYCDIHSCVKAA